MPRTLWPSAFAHAKRLVLFCLAILFLALSPNLAVAASMKGLVGYWPFEEGVGLISNDSSGYENTGILVNKPSWVRGKFGYGLSFNGVDQYVDIVHSDSLNVVDQLTVSAWILNGMSADNQVSEPEFHIIAAKGWAPDAGGSWTLAWDKKSNDLSFCVRKDSDKGYNCVFVNMDAVTHDWHHVAAVFNGGKVSLYVDGLLAAKPIALGTGSIKANAENIRIGGLLETKNVYLQNWEGHIDEVQIYNRALTESEVKALSQQDSKSQEPTDSAVAESATLTATESSSKPGKGNLPVETPSMSPIGGTFAGSVTVTLATATPGASVYYTTDGSVPTESSQPYKDPITLTSDTLLKAKAFKKNSPDSPEVKAWFAITGGGFDFAMANEGDKVAKKGASAQNRIDVSLLSGSSQPVAFSAAGLPSGANASFSTANCGPACSSTLTVTTSNATPAGTFPLTVTGTGGGKSKSTSFNLIVSEDPFDFSLSSAGNQSVTAGASVSNKIDAMLVSGVPQTVVFSASGLPVGAAASFSSASCSPTCSTTMTINTTAGITPGGTSLITVSAVGGGVTKTTTFNLTVAQPTVATPTITPNGGSFTEPTSVSMSTTTAGASIRYTVDGSTPTETSTLYSAPITLSNSATLKAAAFKSDYNPSSVASASFTIVTSCLSGQFRAEYFNNTALSGTPDFTTCVPAINYNWGSGGPENGIGNDQFSARWSGNFSFNAGDYRFTATADDGVKVWVGGTQIINAWKDQGPTTYEATISLTGGTHTVKVEYYENGGGAVAQVGWQEVVAPPTVATPTITPNGGSFSGPVSVSMSTTTSGASIRYTMDGSTPTASSTLYTAPMTLPASATVKAAAFMSNYNPSGVASAAFIITQPFDFSLAVTNNGSSSVTAGSSIGFLASATLQTGTAQSVTYSASGLPVGATAAFATPSCTPTCSSLLTISTTAGTTPGGTSTITVSAVGGGVTRTTTFNLTVNPPAVATPTISPNGGSFSGPVSVTLATTTSGASIRYTTDGSTPTATSTLYSAAFTLANNATVKAAAFKTNYNASALASATFSITASCPAGQFLAEYFNNTTLTGTPTFTTCTPSINNNWGSGGPGNGIGTDQFSARWTGSFSFNAGNYIFTATADDGIRVWVDGNQIINQWKDQSPTTYQATVSLTAGTHVIRVEYYENGGGAVAQVGWQAAPQPSQLIATWQYNSTGQTGFAIERKLGSSGSYGQIATVGSGVTSYTDPTVLSGSLYCYRTQAYNATQVSAYSNEACQTAP